MGATRKGGPPAQCVVLAWSPAVRHVLCFGPMDYAKAVAKSVERQAEGDAAALLPLDDPDTYEGLVGIAEEQPDYEERNHRLMFSDRASDLLESFRQAAFLSALASMEHKRATELLAAKVCAVNNITYEQDCHCIIGSTFVSVKFTNLMGDQRGTHRAEVQISDIARADDDTPEAPEEIPGVPPPPTCQRCGQIAHPDDTLCACGGHIQ